ncbi:MAG: cadmium resistance transporter [Deltaproteobacteria bacterium]|nr:cadmium resistance transporter [Deltaproteobacteria bacterium]
MISIFSAVITGIVTFAGTNVDDLFILMLFFSQTDASFRWPHRIGLLGLFPIAIGVKKFFHRNRNPEPAELDKAWNDSSKLSILSGLFSRQTLGVAAVTLANGGDNLGIYTPLFASSRFFRLSIFLFIFFALVGVWCYAGFSLSRHPIIANIFSRYGRLFVPFVLVGLGVYIMIESGAAALMAGWIRYF